MALPITKEMLSGEKLDLRTIEKMVKEHGFGAEPFRHKGHPYFLTRGPHFAMVSQSMDPKEVEDALDRFFRNDFGTMYDVDERPTPGWEYGCYPSSYGSEPGTGAIMIHREPGRNGDVVVVYFQFER